MYMRTLIILIALAASAQAAGKVAYETYAMNLLEECKPGSVSPELANFMLKTIELQTDDEKRRARDTLLQKGKTFRGNKEKFCAWIEQEIGPTVNSLNTKIRRMLDEVDARVRRERP
jgi:hypothetical protein